MPYYQLTTDEDGNEVYELVDDKEIQLPEDHPLVTTVARQKENLNNTRDRLKQANELLAQAQSDEGDDAGDTTPPPETPPEPTTIDPEALYFDFAKRFREEEQERQNAATERQRVIDDALKEYGLPSGVKSVLSLVTGEEAIKQAAQVLKNSSLIFEETGGGQDDVADFDINNVLKRLDIADD